MVSVSSSSPPRYFVSSYKEPDVLRTRHLLPYACTKVAVEPSSNFDFAYVALFCETRILIKKMGTSTTLRSNFIGSYATFNQPRNIEIFSAVQSSEPEG